jgi:hypothetical protein
LARRIGPSIAARVTSEVRAAKRGEAVYNQGTVELDVALIASVAALAGSAFGLVRDAFAKWKQRNERADIVIRRADGSDIRIELKSSNEKSVRDFIRAIQMLPAGAPITDVKVEATHPEPKAAAESSEAAK